MLDLGLKVYRIVKRKYESGTYIDEHKHDFYHYIYVAGGSGELGIGKKKYRAAVGQLYLVPQHTPHEIWSECDLATVNIKFACHPSHAPLLNRLSHTFGNFSAYEKQIIRDILNEAIEGEPFFEEIIHLRFAEFMMRVLRRNQTETAAPGRLHSDMPAVWVCDERARKDLKHVVDYIGNHIGEPVCICDLARMSGFSESYFSTVFKKVYGVSPRKYIIQLKINKAKEMMMHSDLNITEIAELLGFKEIHYFSRLFKKVTAASPINYIKRCSRDVAVNMSREISREISREHAVAAKPNGEFPQRLPLAR